jgi:hypothetical protein
MNKNIEDIIKDKIKNNEIIVVCCIPECHKTKINNVWYSDYYDEKYKKYSHTYCDECINKYFNDI